MARILAVSAAALIDSDGRILLAQRPSEKQHAGLWEFPGGKIATDETPVDALVRELNEELTIDTNASCLAPFGFEAQDLDDVHLLILLFICRKWTGFPKALEHQALKWVRPTDLLNFEMPPADRPLAAQLRDFLCFST